MLSFVILLILLFVIFFGGYIVSDGDFFAPTCIATLGFIFSTICAAINSGYWGLQLENKTIEIIIGGLFCYLIIETIVKTFIFGKYKSTASRFSSTYHSLNRINIAYGIMGFFLVGEIGAILLYLRQVVHVARRHGGSGSLALLLNLYRNLSSFHTLDKSDTFPFWLNLLYVTVIGLGFFWAYILINNYMIDKKISKSTILNVLLVIVSIVMNMANANRTRMIELAISIAVYIWFFQHRVLGWKSRMKFKTLIKVAVAVIVFILLFFGVRNLVGRNDSRSLLYVITHYFGVPIAGLNEFLKNPISSPIWGKETFAGINNYIGAHFNKSDLVYATQKEFRTIQGINIGNVYTAFRSYIHDFGVGGTIVLTSIESCIMSVAYYSIKKRVSNKIIDTRLLLFPIIYYANVLMFYADWFYEQITIWTFRMVVILLFFIILVNKKGIRLGTINLVGHKVKKM